MYSASRIYIREQVGSFSVQQPPYTSLGEVFSYHDMTLPRSPPIDESPRDCASLVAELLTCSALDLG